MEPIKLIRVTLREPDLVCGMTETTVDVNQAKWRGSAVWLVGEWVIVEREQAPANYRQTLIHSSNLKTITPAERLPLPGEEQAKKTRKRNPTCRGVVFDIEAEIEKDDERQG